MTRWEFAARWTNVIAGDDAVWATVDRAGGRDIVRIDPDTNIATTVVPNLTWRPNPVHGMAVNGSIWISSWDLGTVTQYDADTGEQLAELTVGASPIEPVMAFGDVWTMNHHGGSLSRIDTDAGTVAATIDVAAPGDAGPLFLDVGDGLLWEAAPNTPVVIGIDPATNRVARRFDLDPECRPDVAYFGEQLWVGGCSESVQILDPKSGEQEGESDVHVLGSAFRLEVDGRAWMPTGDPQYGDPPNTLIAVDTATGEVVDTFTLPGEFDEDVRVTVGFGSLWLYSGKSGNVVRVPASALPGS